MDTSRHSLEDLFSQLGLANSEAAIEAFCSNNRLPPHIPLEQAAFWSSGQAQFIHEAIAEDADWAEVVDQLDAQLRH
ncbi:DUF2789 domain-containing protein [Dasania sp. GY-MA-18]|uniref:DUF2789 domain-containing protein n=1 Tax=Dasania phycosphaerae TaxID=2950436 RepID=A0A9J6RL31_9GAMM|nr:MULTISPECIES: DUF2789 domain-containing protein [Dasania]MCR8922281.1 DUF2789 domain-containing protein [Dasania sp. GY-MA-18]MCZ0864709.1 DUF2789 domain-containing protein [Dasania phycosphaerae]MCZ0868437.1 DUF2789 domain-containing protein [Dasania phycosphaerae]